MKTTEELQWKLTRLKKRNELDEDSDLEQEISDLKSELQDAQALALYTKRFLDFDNPGVCFAEKERHDLIFKDKKLLSKFTMFLSSHIAGLIFESEAPGLNRGYIMEMFGETEFN